MPQSILKSRRFLPLLITQFFGALNDNLFKNALLLMVTVKMAQQAAVLSNVIAGLFILPFFIFSATAGEISDKYDKSRIAQILKVTELVLMVMAAIVYTWQSLWGLILLLFLMGTQSTFFGPVKYALLPAHLKSEELALGNAYIEATTYLAILAGLILGTLLPLPAVLGLLITMAATGLVSSLYIPQTQAARKDAKIHKNIITATLNTLKIIRQDRTVFLCILGATWFWMIGAFVVVQIYPLSGNVLNVANTVITFFLILFSVGVACGSVFCGHLMKGSVHATYTPLSALIMGVCFYVLYLLTDHYPTPDTPVTLAHFFSAPHAFSISLAIFVMAFFGGLYIVPLNTVMQKKASKAYLATVIGGNNIFNALGMVLIAVLTIILLSVGLSISELFLAVAVLSVFVFLCICELLPGAFWRSVLRSIFELLFKVDVKGVQNIKKAGKRVLFVANHTSLLDGLLLAAFMDDDVTFAVNTMWAKKKIMKFFAHFVHFAPLNPTNPMSMRTLIADIKEGKRVMIFPEGRITTTGGLMKIYEGAGMIAFKSDARVVPVKISGANMSKFSYLKTKMKTRCCPKIKLTFLKPVRLKAPDNLLPRQQRHYICMRLYDVMINMLYRTTPVDEHIFNMLLKASKLYGAEHKIAEDINRKPLTYAELIKKSYVLGYALAQDLANQNYVGVMLPNSLADLVCFYGLESVDKIPVMLNFSFGLAQATACLKALELKTIISSRAFVEKAGLNEMVEMFVAQGVKIIFLEDFAHSINIKTKCIGWFHYQMRQKPKSKADDTAVVLFTSGSEGLPKAVLLSHKNLLANRAQLLSVLAVNPSDVFFNALPMFHSFGLGIGGVATVLSGIKTFFYPSPLHYRIVPEMIYDTNATIICGTDTFFYGYARKGHPYDFFHLKYAIVGGEKLKTRTAELFMKKFGVRIMEGYGATETSPVIALNTPMNYKENTVGRVLPGITYKIEKVAGIEDGGLLKVKADNVMKGYILPGEPLVVQPVKDGWYDTGDIVVEDEDGFISILGRVKRFAKIAGEMVSLAAVESVLEKLFASSKGGVVAVKDDRKGEKLVFVTNDETADIEQIKQFFKAQQLSELWMPKSVVYMKNPPLLGNGKFDYLSVQKIIEEMKP